MVMTLALTLERATAVFLPYWYKIGFKPIYRYIAIAAGLIITVTHLSVTLVMAYNSKNVYLDTCPQTQSSGKSFSMFSITTVALTYIFCFCLNLLSYNRARAKSVRLNREMQRIKLMCWISLISMMSVVIPFFVLGIHISLLSKAALRNSYTLLIFSLIPIDSASNLFLYLWLKRLFRARAKSLLRQLCAFASNENKGIATLKTNGSDYLLTSSKAETSTIQS